MSKTDTAKPEADELHASTPLTLLQRLHAVMSEVAYVQKDHTIDMGKRGYKVVTHDAVTAKVRPALVKHGVFYYPHSITRRQEGQRTEIDMVVRFVNVDSAADHLDVPTCGYGLDSGDKGPGKAMSYAVKYALLKALGLETGEDADNEASPEETRQPSGETVKRGPRGGTDKTPPADNELKLYGYPTPGGSETITYQRTSKDLARWVDDMEYTIQHDASAWERNCNMIDIVMEGIAGLERRGTTGAHDLRERMQTMETLSGDAKFLRAG